MTNQIKKGKRFELWTAHHLTKQTGAQWHRVPQSGATATTKQLLNTSWKGDVFTENKQYNNYVVECKHHSRLELNELFSKKSKLCNWIRKLEGYERWILFIKADHKGIYVISSTQTLLDFKLAQINSLVIPGYFNMIKIM